MKCRNLNLYDVLRILPTATPHEAGSAYRTMVHKWHPGPEPDDVMYADAVGSGATLLIGSVYRAPLSRLSPSPVVWRDPYPTTSHTLIPRISLFGVGRHLPPQST
ncbi:J domain-containing protein [Arthrobacter psychrolactophilus]|uniref:J domain-containing protein n=1 Tax=Arthrobacter psychrolactophilus TaxID=92442 RepID=UPI0011B45643|nr:J domain-containing protein [Arthrobacter psychrolactophilus]